MNEAKFDVQISSIQTAYCPQGSISLTHTVTRDEDNLRHIPTPSPYNNSTLKTEYFASHNLGFDGIEFTDRFTATICYPTPNDLSLIHI